MSDYISQFEIEQMSEQQLRVKFYELFNKLALRQQTKLNCDEMRYTLSLIQAEIQKRYKK